MSWKELLITALIGALLIFWFSFWGPTEVSAPAPRGQGYEQRGESGLVVAGAGAEIVTVGATIGRPPDPGETEETRAIDDRPYETACPEAAPDPLRGYWYGVGAVILGQVVILMFGRRNDDE